MLYFWTPRHFSDSTVIHKNCTFPSKSGKYLLHVEPSRQMKSFHPLPVLDLHFKMRNSRKITGCLGWWITTRPETKIRNCSADVHSEILCWYNQTCMLKQVHSKFCTNGCIYCHECWFRISVHTVGHIQADSRPCASLIHTHVCVSLQWDAFS